MGRKNNLVFGFTLIELIIVIAILASLLLITLVVFNPAKQFAKARDGQRKSDLNNIYKALMMYKNDYSFYPESSSNQIRGCLPLVTFPWGGGAFKCGDMVYMKSLPQDPKGTATYKYSRSASGDDFCLWATLENAEDPDSAKYLSRCLQCVDATAGDIVVCSD